MLPRLLWLVRLWWKTIKPKRNSVPTLTNIRSSRPSKTGRQCRSYMKAVNPKQKSLATHSINCLKQYFKEYTQEERDQIIRNHGKEIAVLEAPKRIEMIAADILEHYRNKIEPEGFGKHRSSPQAVELQFFIKKQSNDLMDQNVPS